MPLKRELSPELTRAAIHLFVFLPLYGDGTDPAREKGARSVELSLLPVVRLSRPASLATLREKRPAKLVERNGRERGDTKRADNTRE